MNLKRRDSFRLTLYSWIGLKSSAYMDRVQIDRIVPFEDRKALSMDRIYKDVNIGELIEKKMKFTILDDDKIKVFPISDTRQNFVEISGAIMRPGMYEIDSGLKLKDLIVKADSLSGDAYLDRVDIVRTKPDFTEELIKLDLSKVLKNDDNQNIFLKSFDKVKIFSLTDMVPNSFVSINGHVKYPGQYVLQDSLTIYDLIFKAGGFIDLEFRKKTFLKRADLIRTSKNRKKEIVSFDLSKVLDGSGISQMLMAPDDNIKIFSKEEIMGSMRYFSIYGHVKNPGEYELYENNMKISDALFIAGGFDDPLHLLNTFTKRGDIYRFAEDRIEKKIISFELGEILNDSSHVANIQLEPGDEIKIYSKKIFNIIKTVTIDGAVNKPGKYEFKNAMTLKDLILESEGLSKDVYRYLVDIDRIDPYNNEENKLAKSVQVEMNNDFSIINRKGGELVGDYSLEAYDNIYIRPDPFFTMQKKVEVVGEVYYPGFYTILSSDETVSDIIKRAGGLRFNAFVDGSKYVKEGNHINFNLRKILKNPNSKYDFVVADGDKIIVGKNPNLINIVGAVNSEGLYIYEKGIRVNDAIRMAGVLNTNADIDQIFITYPNGRSEKYSRFLNNSKVIDGSIINVGVKEEEEPFDKTEYFKELTSIIASLSQAISIVLIARN